jgi:hypothetical protein
MSDDSAPSTLLLRASGVFLFLALSGVVPFLARYGVFSQWVLLLHILVGIVAIVPVTLSLWKHGRKANREVPTRWWSPGLWAGLGWITLGGSGVCLVAKGLWGIFVPYRMHHFHLVAGITFGAVGLFHIAQGLVRSKFPEQHYAQLARPLIFCAVVFVAGAAFIGIARPGSGVAGDFVPSNARTDTGQVIAANLLVGSETCGATRCHTTIYEEWVPSAHHFSGSDPFYAIIKANYVRAQGVGSGRYCAGCHEPISLLSGETIPAHTSPTSQAGSSCIFCHVLRNPDTRGNANYVATAPHPYLFEFSPSPTLRSVSQALIRLHPEQHKRDYDVKHVQSVEFCGTCHKQYLDKRVNGWGFVQLQNQYDNTKVGHAFPTGPLDVIQSWLEFTVRDAQNQPVFSAGTLDATGRLVGKTLELRSFLLDRKAQVLYNHALWDAVGARDKRVILPGASDSEEFRFPVPRGVAGPLHCRVRLLYRKFNPDSLAAIFPDTTPPPVPITEISSASIDVAVMSGQGTKRASALVSLPRSSTNAATGSAR